MKIMEIFTIGHSVLTKETFISMIKEAEITHLADVRAFPGSRKFPHFKKCEMEVWLPEAGIEYEHYPLLGGRRNKSESIQDNLNDGWDNRSFHNYADYTLTDNNLKKASPITKNSQRKKTAYCCSERHPARCHRLIISNWLCAHGWDVTHLLLNSKGKLAPVSHELGEWGAMPILEKDHTVVYPNLG